MIGAKAKVIYNAFGFPIGEVEEEHVSLMARVLRFGFKEPTKDNAARLAAAQALAAEIRERNAPPCLCDTCVSIRNLPNVQRIIAKWPLRGDFQ